MIRGLYLGNGNRDQLPSVRDKWGSSLLPRARYTQANSVLLCILVLLFITAGPITAVLLCFISTDACPLDFGLPFLDFGVFTFLHPR